MLHQDEKASDLVKNNSATIIQKLARGYIARKIKPLPQTELSDYTVMFAGNDPQIQQFINSYKPTSNKRIALIGTSGIRSIQIACELSHGQDKSLAKIPKVIIIDDSKHVIAFWKIFQKFVSKLTAKTIEEITPELISFLNANRFEMGNNQLNLIHHYFTDLVEKFGMPFVRDTIKDVMIIPQDWKNTTPFIKVKSLLTRLDITDIYVYPSNIVRTNLAYSNKILENIAYLNPNLTMHTDLCVFDQCPEQIVLSQKHDPKLMQKAIPTIYEFHKSYRTIIFLFALLYGVLMDLKNLEISKSNASNLINVALFVGFAGALLLTKERPQGVSSKMPVISVSKSGLITKRIWEKSAVHTLENKVENATVKKTK